jgi:hypothetical protein
MGCDSLALHDGHEVARQPVREFLEKVGRLLHEFLFGAAMSWVMAPHTLKQHRALERVFMLMTVGDLMGFPFAPPLSGLRLLPFMVPRLLSWRRSMILWDDVLEGVDLRHIGH